MSERFTIRHSATERDSFGNYDYDVLDGTDVIARYWHDYRGAEHGIRFADGTSEDWPVGRMIDFINGGGPEPLTLSPAAIKWLHERIAR
jgi:hypothetical protein